MPAWKLFPVAFLALAVPVVGATPPSAVPGRYANPSGQHLRLAAAAGGYRVTLPDGSSHQVVIRDGRLTPRVVGAAGVLRGDRGGTAPSYALCSEAGRLVLDGPGGPFRRLNSNPWWRLGAQVRRDVAQPLARHQEGEGFGRWFQQRYGETPVARDLAHAEWRFDQLSWGQRVGLIAVYTKMKADEVWDLVHTIKYAGGDGVLLFKPTGTQPELAAALEAKTFGDYWKASRGNPWGVRSRFRGVQLHFRGSEDEWVNAHIDFVNPGDPIGGSPTPAWKELGLAAAHYEIDLRGWTRNHTPGEVLRWMQRAGFTLDVPR